MRQDFTDRPRPEWVVLQTRHHGAQGGVDLQVAFRGHPHQGVGGHSHLGDACEIVDGVGGDRRRAVEGSHGFVHDNVSAVGHHHAGSWEGFLDQGHFEQAVHAQGDLRPCCAPGVHPSAQALMSLPGEAIAFAPGSVHGGHRELSLHRRHAHQGIRHCFTRACIVLVRHHDALDKGRQCGEVFEGVGVAHPDQRDATRIDALCRQGLDQGRNAFSLQPKIARGAMAHF